MGSNTFHYRERIGTFYNLATYRVGCCNTEQFDCTHCKLRRSELIYSVRTFGIIFSMSSINQIPPSVAKFDKSLPHFSDGRIDYSNSDSAPVLTCFIMSNKKILLLRRSGKVATYKGLWNTVAGYLDEAVPLSHKVSEELKEELHITPKQIESMKIGKIFKIKDTDINMTWIVHPVLVQIKERPKIKLDWEHTAYKWISPDTLEHYEVVPDLGKSLNYALATVN